MLTNWTDASRKISLRSEMAGGASHDHVAALRDPGFAAARPPGTFPLELGALVQPVVLAHPELDRRGDQAKAAPAGGAGHLLVLVLAFQGGVPVQQLVVSDRPALGRGQRRQPVPARAGGEVGVVLGRAEPFNLTLDAHLPSQRLPPEHHRCSRVAASSSPLRLPRLVKKRSPPSDSPRNSTKRTLGAPSRLAVARAIASASGTPAATASSIQRWNSIMGSSGTGGEGEDDGAGADIWQQV